MDFSKLTIKTASEALRKGDLKVADLVQYYLDQIAEKNPEINAFLEIFDDTKEQAERAQKMIDAGEATELTGIPIAIKDNILIKGRKQSASSKVLENYEIFSKKTVEISGVKVEKFLCTFEYLNPPLHTIELYFVVSKNGGEMILGKDPELTDQEQLISEIAFLSVEKIAQIKKSEKHQLFWNIKSIKDVGKWKGYFKFENKSIK
jgi:hypothetical protein